LRDDGVKGCCCKGFVRGYQVNRVYIFHAGSPRLLYSSAIFSKVSCRT
jgi:hypothetical protein